jgi:hypothetical protein
VSLRWRSELLVRLGAQHCEVSLPQGVVHSVEGTGATAIHAALGELVARGHALPRRARVLLSEDLLHLCVVDAHTERAQTENQAQACASALLAQVLGGNRDDRQVEVSLLDNGDSWLAAAVDIAALDQALDALMHHGVDARRVGMAVLEDLRAVRAHLPREVHTVALVREHGVSLLGFERGRLVAVEWEHLDWRDRDTLFARLAAYAGPPAAWPSAIRPVAPSGTAARGRTGFLQPESARQEAVLGGAARDTGWVMLPPRLGTGVAGNTGGAPDDRH